MAVNFYTEEIGYEPKFDFDEMNVVIKNGQPELINKVEAIRQWVVKFAMTQKEVYPIYEGTGYGTRLKSLFGKKRIGLGYEEAEVERDFREGLLLCPAIAQVTDFSLKKKGKILNIELSVELYDGEIVDMEIEKAYVFNS